MKLFFALALVAGAFAITAQIQSETTDHSVSFKASELQENTTLGEVSFSCNSAGFPRVRAGVGASMGGNSTFVARYEYRVGLLEIMEAVCADNDKGFVEASDLSAARRNAIDLRSADGSSWSAIAMSQQTVDGSVVHIAETHYPAAAQWKLSIQLKLAEKDAHCATVPYVGTVCSPSALRVVIRTQQLSYTLGSNSRYVLKFAVDSSEAATLTQSNATDVGRIDLGSFLSLKWSTNATADSQESNLVASSLAAADSTTYPGDDDRKDSESHKVIYFTLPTAHPTTVDWEYDVAIDVARFASPAPRSALLGTGAAVVAALAALMAL